MYIINKETNRIEKIESTTFKQLGFKERDHLQEWIANNPSCLYEEDWSKMFNFMLQHLTKFEGVFKKTIQFLSRK